MTSDNYNSQRLHFLILSLVLALPISSKRSSLISLKGNTLSFVSDACHERVTQQERKVDEVQEVGRSHHRPGYNSEHPCFWCNNIYYYPLQVLFILHLPLPQSTFFKNYRVFFLSCFVEVTHMHRFIYLFISTHNTGIIHYQKRGLQLSPQSVSMARHGLESNKILLGHQGEK